MSITKNVFTLKKAYELIVDGQWATFSTFESLSPGELWTWGGSKNYSGTNTSGGAYSSPTQIPGSEWVDLSRHTDAPSAFSIKTDGTLWSWGFNNAGRLGLNDVINRSSPTQVPGNQWIQAPQGSNAASMAIKSDGTLWAWGSSFGGTLCPTGFSGSSISSPTQIPGNSWCQVSAHVQALAIKTNGTLWVWGSGNYGRLGLNSTSNALSPTQIPGSWSFGSAGIDRSFAIKTDGTIWSWGCGVSGALGLNDTIPRSSPTQIPGTSWSFVNSRGSGGGARAISIKTDGTMWSWGCNYGGALGLNDVINRSSPSQVPGTNWICASTGHSSVGLKSDGTLWSFGCNSDGSLGINLGNTTRSSPVQIPGNNWIGIVTMEKYSFAKKSV